MHYCMKQEGTELALPVSKRPRASHISAQGALQRVAACCSLLQCVARPSSQPGLCSWCVAACCSVLQNVPLCCKSLQLAMSAPLSSFA